jgi:signal transduction histidine kinase
MLDEAGKKQIQLLLGRVEGLVGLIECILLYSRIGRLERNRQEIDTGALLAEVIDSLMPPSSIQITVEQNLPFLHMNKTRIMQVFQNLIGNALKFIDKADGRIRIGCQDVGQYWQFSVADNGPGIDPKYHEKIFQIFQVLQPRDELESTGIGLSLVKKIVELYGGKVWVESAVGQGSTFFFTLPK